MIIDQRSKDADHKSDAKPHRLAFDEGNKRLRDYHVQRARAEKHDMPMTSSPALPEKGCKRSYDALSEVIHNDILAGLQLLCRFSLLFSSG